MTTGKKLSYNDDVLLTIKFRKERIRIMRKRMSKIISLVMAVILLAGVCGISSSEVNVKAAPKTKISRKTATVRVGNTVSLSLRNARGRVSWSSGNESVAKVSKRGVVTGIKSGTVKITAKCKNKKYRCTVTVKTSIINAEKRTLPIGQSYQLWVLTNYPEDNQTVNDVKVSSNVKWESYDSGIARVNANGLVTACMEGETTIAATVRGETYYCYVTVVKALGYDDFSYKPNDEMAVTYASDGYYSDRWYDRAEHSDIAKKYSHFGELFEKAAGYHTWYTSIHTLCRSYSSGMQNEENRGIIIGDTIEDVWAQYGQADGEINQTATRITNWYSSASNETFANREGITSQMIYSYKDTSNSDITNYQKRFYFDSNNTLILIEWRVYK